MRWYQLQQKNRSKADGENSFLNCNVSFEVPRFPDKFSVKFSQLTRKLFLIVGKATATMAPAGDDDGSSNPKI